MQITKETIREKIKPRDAFSHKGTFGKLCIVSGCAAYSGAAVLSSRAAARTGAGLVNLCSVKQVIDRAAVCTPEITYTYLPETANGTISSRAVPILLDQGASAWLIGCGLSLDKDTAALARELVTSVERPMVLDADGLNAVARDCGVLHYKRAPIVVTPHMGEMSRLTGKPIEWIQASREQTALDFAYKYGVTVVLKGHDTVIATEKGDVHINPTGNAGMARGGSGDVLAGMTGAFLAQGFSAVNAALCAVYLHGLAGDICKEKYTEFCMLPSDLIEQLGEAYKAVLK